jgi:trk system potassium uptake protein TrkH
MLDIRPILLVIGLSLTTLGGAMLLPAFTDIALDDPDWRVFLASAALTLFIGVSLSITNWGYSTVLNLQQAFLLTIFSWVALAAFAAMPLAFSGLGLSYADAFFESMSGLTTTGSTVIQDLDGAPPGILIWRALLQWLGGIGIVVMAVALLPMLQIGGMQLFRVEAFDTPEKVLPSAARFAVSITLIYLGLTSVCFVSLVFAGMPPFDAMAHSMTTIATGGFSTRNASVGAFDSAAIDYIVTVFMIAGSLPFALYLQTAQGKSGALFRDSQVRAFLVTLLFLVAAMTAYHMYRDVNAGWDSFRFAAFNVVSVMTGTGYSTQNYGLWGPFAVVALFWIMFIGGCAGSTSCGIKIFRFQVIFAALWAHIRKMLHPHGVFPPHYGGRPIEESVTASVMSFFFLFFASIVVFAYLLSLMGLDFMTALSSAATAISNVGPGLGEMVGPSGTFHDLPDGAKWLLSAAMLLGRLEIFTVLIIFTPSFWRF